MSEEVRISWGDKVAQRYESNQRIVEILSELVEKFPQWRFQQILQNVDVRPGMERICFTKRVMIL